SRTPQGLLAAAPASRARLRYRVHGPGEHRLRVPADESGPAVQRHRVRIGWRALLCQLRTAGGAVEPAAGPLRRPALACADHADVGPPRRGHDVREDADAVLRHAVSAWGR